ncbi:uncharacterized protein [Anoplolepis gracilipes]|uniref:uncharacterized protein n=1 Tax=Anoplolepis gracilipes TaxID=354296 RepID=UPI003B9F04F9
MLKIFMNIMSENTSEERNNLFRDYKSENFDDSDLQSRLYAEIYYEPVIRGESETLDISKTIQFSNMNAELNNEPLEFETARDKSNKAKKISRKHSNQNTSLNETSLVEPLMYNDALQAQTSVDGPVSVEIQTNIDELSSQEINPVIYECDNINNDNPGNSSVEKEKRRKESSAKKTKSSNHAKNELKKDKQTSDSSDSEESIFEVPVPPKPKPPLINLQDSDEENNTNSEVADPIVEMPATSCKDTKIRGISSNHQNTSFTNKNTDKSLHTKDTTVNPESIHTCIQEIREDIVLNCTIVQRGAKSISEIKQLSKSAKLNKNQEDITTEDTNQNSTKQLSQNTSKETNVNFQQNIGRSNACNKYNLRSKNNTLDAKTSCRNNDTIIDRKRQNDSRIENSTEKRQCIVQQNNQNVIQQSSSSSSGERRTEVRNEYFKSMPETLRNYYYSSRSQENFDVAELQRGMSKDPRMWVIMDEDLMPSPPSRQRTRFWNVRCSNCQRDGHQRYDCPVPRRTPCCYICGEKGHVESRCRQKICFTCGKKQNTFRQTCEYCRVLYCTMCHSVGHESTQCPDLWRRYHKTTDVRSTLQNPDNVMKPPSLLHCCNCTKRGHESSMCKEFRWSLHFPTPAAVTNYVDGPKYSYLTNFSESDFEMDDSLSSKTTNSRSSISHSPKNIQQTVKEHSKSSTSIDTLSSNAKTNETLIPQRTLCNSETEGNLKSTSLVNKVLCSQEKQKNHRQDGINEKEFITIIFACGKFHDKNNKDARIISRNLSLLKNDLSPDGKKTILSSLPRRKIVPVFLKTLFDKAIEFEVKIGFMIHQPKVTMLQLIAMKEYIELIYDLLLHWINLPENEKDYGVDVTLPMNPTKMFNHLCSRMPQLTKMSFTCYNDHIKGINDPRFLFNIIKQHKVQLKQQQSNKKYSRLRKRMWRSQVKLLMIVNTEPKPNIYVSEFQNAMEQLEFEKRDQKTEKLDSATYLKLTLLYNRLFVPHTPVALFKTLQRIEKHAHGNKDTDMIAKNTNCSPQMLQELQKDGICEQDLASQFNATSSLSSTISCTSQNINSVENPSVIDIQQNTSNETLIERGNVIDISPTIDDTIDCNDNEVMIIENSVAQDSQTTMPLNTEIFNHDQPIDSLLIPIEDRNADQPLTKSLNIEYNTSVSKPNVKAKNNKNLARVQQWQIKQQLKEQKRERKRGEAIKNICQNASYLIEEARALNVPHMNNAANELERKLNNHTIRLKHVDVMKKMIKLEKKYRKNVSSYWEDLKA